MTDIRLYLANSLEELPAIRRISHTKIGTLNYFFSNFIATYCVMDSFIENEIAII